MKHFISLFLLFLSIYVQAQNALKYRQLQAQADIFFEKADYTQAIVLYKKMLPISLKPRVENYYIAASFSRLQQTDSAVFYFKKALKLGLRYSSMSDIDTDDNLNILKTYTNWADFRKIIVKNTKKYIAQNNKIQYPTLKNELLERKKTDQLYRNIMSPNTPPKTLDSLNILQHKMDKANTDWLKIQIKKHGWLGIKEVGKEGDNAAWLLVQHADKDTTFQINVLKILVKQVKINNTDKMNFAYLTDRILVNTGKKQLFATQIKETIKDSTGKVTNLIFQPLQNESQTDSLRAEVGLPTQAEYKADFMKHLNRKMKE